VDKITITILPDGTIKAETDKVSAINHASAEAFMRQLATAGGGQQTRKHKAGLLGAALHAIQHATGGHGHSH
jgi:hypothetical protein